LPKVAIEVSWVYANLADSSKEQTKIKLIEKYEYLECLSIMLSKNNSKIDALVLEALQNILKIKHPKIYDFIENDFSNKVSHINYTKQNQKAIEVIQDLLEEMGFKNVQLKLAAGNPGRRKENEQDPQDQDDDDDEEEEEDGDEKDQSDDQNED